MINHKIVSLLIMIGIIAGPGQFSWPVALAATQDQNSNSNPTTGTCAIKEDGVDYDYEDVIDVENQGPFLSEFESLSAFDMFDGYVQSVANPTPSNLRISGSDILSIRDNEVDLAVEQMILCLQKKHPDHLKVQRIKKGYITERKQFSKDTPVESDEQAPISAHHTGQAFKISEVDTFTCKIKSLTGSKDTPPRPIKVAWQTQEGLARSGDLPGLDTSSYHTLLGSMGGGIIDQLITEEVDFDNPLIGPYGDYTLANIIGFSGEAAIKSAGLPGPPIFGANAGSPEAMALWTARQILAKSSGNQLGQTAFIGQTHEEFLQNAGRSHLEKLFNLPEGSLAGKNTDELLANLGKRQLEQLVGKRPGAFSGEIKTWLNQYNQAVERYQPYQPSFLERIHGVKDRSQADAADLALNLPAGTTDRLRDNNVAGLKLIGAFILGNKTKMANKNLNDWLDQIRRKDRGATPIPFYNFVEVGEIKINYDDLTKIFSNDPLRDKTFAKIGQSALNDILKNNRLFSNAYIGLKADEIAKIIRGEEKLDTLLTKIADQALGDSLGLPDGVITKTLQDIQQQKLVTKDYSIDSDGDGFPDGYFNDVDGNGVFDGFETEQYRQERQSWQNVLITNIGRLSTTQQGKNGDSLSPTQAKQAGDNFLTNQVIAALRLDFNLAGYQIDENDVTRYLVGDTQTMVDKTGSDAVDLAIGAVAGATYSFQKNAITAGDLMENAAVNQLGKIVGISGERANLTTDSDGNVLTSRQNPTQQNTDRLIDKIAPLTDKLTSETLLKWFDWDDQTAQRYGDTAFKTVASSILTLATDNASQENRQAASQNLVNTIDTVLSAKGQLAAGTFHALIFHPDERPQILLDEASIKLSQILFPDEPGKWDALQAVYDQGRLQFNVNLHKLGPTERALAEALADRTGIIKTSGDAHDDVVLFFNGHTSDAWQRWGLAQFVTNTINKDNPFGDQFQLTYQELSAAYFGDQSAEQKFIDQKINEIQQAGRDLEDPEVESMVTDWRANYRLETRQKINDKILDITIAKQTGLPIFPGFAEAMLSGSNEDRATALVRVALGDLGQSQLGQIIGLTVSNGQFQTFEDFVKGKTSLGDFQSQAGDDFLNALLKSDILNDSKIGSLTGIAIQAGTGQSFEDWVFGQTPYGDFQTSVQSKYNTNFFALELSKFFDKTTGFPAGTTYQLYTMYQQYQNLYNTMIAYQELFFASGSPESLNAATQARADFKAGTVVLVVQAVDLITGGAITKLTSPLDNALGLPPGTVLNAALALISGNPVMAAIIIITAILGFGKVSCPDLQLLAQGKTHQVISEVLAISKEETDAYGTIHQSDYTYNNSLVPQQIITWGDYKLYPNQHGFPDWVKDLLPIANDIYNPVIPGTNDRRSDIPGIYENVGFFPLETMWDSVHIGW